MMASEETCTAWEGCISNNDELCLVERPIQLKVRFHTIEGKEIDLFCEGIVARVFMHEIDHLEGKLMWEEEQGGTFRKLIRSQPISELHDEATFSRFIDENKKYILDS